ncbi:universal stress protein [Streptomyces thermolineatus]|uniref:Universal stress protein n=1 Tax=Streptomyces thermolineatus TaxID=44033 RepID=A0ABN3M6C5_9ACTN
MLEPITVGVDGSDESLAATRWAAREATLRDLPLRVVHAWERRSQPEWADLLTDMHGWAEKLLSGAAEEVRGSHPGLPVSTDLLPALPVPALLGASGNSRMLVLGSRGLGTVSGFLLGSVGLAVAARSDCPVVSVRAGSLPEEGAGYGEIVLGIDVEQAGEALLEFAFDAAARRSAPLRIVHTWNFPAVYAYAYGYGMSIETDLRGDLERAQTQALTEVLAPWRERFPGVQITPEVVSGPASEQLLQRANTADLVIVGRRHRAAPVGPRLGSVAHAVLHHATCPVAVVPHD